MNLGYCVVHYMHEQGMQGQVVVVTHTDLWEAQSLVETLSGYPRDHERYKQEVFNLTKMYHEEALGLLDDKYKRSLKQYSPEAFHCIEDISPVDYSVQVFRPLGTRHWINRRFDSVVDHVNEENRIAAEARQARKQEGTLS